MKCLYFGVSRIGGIDGRATLLRSRRCVSHNPETRRWENDWRCPMAAEFLGELFKVINFQSEIPEKIRKALIFICQGDHPES